MDPQCAPSAAATSSTSEPPLSPARCDTGLMGSSDYVGYCSFTKAIEHLGDRWLLLIVRELGMFGPLGFNELATAPRPHLQVRTDRAPPAVGGPGPGVARGQSRHARAVPPDRRRQRSDAHHSLVRGWADIWIPDDPEMVEREPAIVLDWLAQRVARDQVATRPVVVEFRLRHEPERRYWLVLQRDIQPYGCLTNPFLDASRYVYLECAISTLLALAEAGSLGRRLSRTVRSPLPAIPAW